MNYKIHPLAEILPEIKDEEFATLAEDIKNHGQLETIKLYKKKVVDGRHRLRVCELLDTTPIVEDITDYIDTEYDGNIADYIISENLHRRHLSASQKALVLAELARLGHGERQDYAEAHQCASAPLTQRQKAAVGGHSRRTQQNADKVAEKCVDEIKDLVKNDEATVKDAAKIADKPPEVQRAAAKAVSEGTRTLAGAVNAAERKAAVAEKTTAPEGEYNAVVCDPPWQIQQHYRTSEYDEAPYEKMNLQDIAEMKPPVADGGWLFLWVAMAYLPAGLKLIKDWGLDYRFTMVWHKSSGPTPPGRPVYNHEIVIVASKGEAVLGDTVGTYSCFEAKTRGHSVKPDEFYKIVAQMTGKPRLDMYARTQRDGWEVWGNEI